MPDNYQPQPYAQTTLGIILPGLGFLATLFALIDKAVSLFHNLP